MLIYITNTEYISSTEIVDVPNIPFLNCRNPLYIGAKDGQVRRMLRNIRKEKLGGTAVGWWELVGNPGYITRKGKLNLDKFREHDIIFISAPDRIHEDLKVSYINLIDSIKAALC